MRGTTKAFVASGHSGLTIDIVTVQVDAEMMTSLYCVSWDGGRIIYNTIVSPKILTYWHTAEDGNFVAGREVAITVPLLEVINARHRRVIERQYLLAILRQWQLEDGFCFKTKISRFWLHPIFAPAHIIFERLETS